MEVQNSLSLPIFIHDNQGNMINIILYYNPDTEQPLKLIMLSYQGMLQASREAPILLNGLA
ncbi:MAG: hypothetical protein Fur0021_29110 [Candidatus Promineifilaceae bacterium]